MQLLRKYDVDLDYSRFRFQNGCNNVPSNMFFQCDFYNSPIKRWDLYSPAFNPGMPVTKVK